MAVSVTVAVSSNAPTAVCTQASGCMESDMARVSSATARDEECIVAHGRMEWNTATRHQTYSNGDSYSGSWSLGVRSGAGLLTHSDGASYSDQFRDDEPCGQGKHIHSSGAEYSGEWLHGRLEGCGSIRYKSESVYTSGELLRTGIGPAQKLRSTSNGAPRYSGEWARNSRHGIGS